MARIKPNPEVVANLKQAEVALAEIAEIDRELAIINAAMNEVIDQAKAQAEKQGQTRLDRRKELANAVGTFATLNKAELFKDKKSIELSYGHIGFRQSTQIAQVPRITQDMSLEKLHEYDFLEGIRLKEELNKETMQAWTDEKLSLVGLKRKVTDAFYIEIKAENVATTAA